jgi:hypothetical protein
LVNDPVTRSTTLDALLAHLSTRQLEVEVVAVLNVLLLVDPDARPAMGEIVSSIKCPSVLADEIVRQMYGDRGQISWTGAHSGSAPGLFEVDAYFEKFWTAHVPPILLHNLQHLEEYSGLPFVSQWAYEWAELCRSTGARFPGYAYYFDEAGSARSGIVGQYIQRQSDIYRSAYLRTMAWAVDTWRMPLQTALEWALDCLPAVKGFFDLDAVQPPTWVTELAEQCAGDPESLEVTIRSFAAGNPQVRDKLVSLHTPLPLPHRYGDLSIKAHFITADFKPSTPSQPFQPLKLLSAAERLSSDVPLGEDAIEEARQQGANGWSLPAGTSAVPQPHGFWQNDFHAAGFTLPASYVVPQDAAVECRRGVADVFCANDVCAITSYWLDHWTHSYPKDGNTRCGSACLINDPQLAKVAIAMGAELAWKVEFRDWVREREFDDFKPKSKRLLVRLS